jgi:signal peptidase I
LPGETISVINGRVIVINDEYPNGFTLDESYLDPMEITIGSSSVTLGESEYFVMGDNRSVSADSRSWGPLDKDKIVGVVRLRIWPLDEAHAFATPQY